jgi:hypothetical protein
MAITVYEKPTSRKSLYSLQRSSSIDYEWFALTTANEDETAVLTAVTKQLTFEYNGFDNLVIDHVTAEALGGPYWQGVANYTLLEGGDESDAGEQGDNSAGDSGDTPDPQGQDNTSLDNQFGFEIGAGTTHIVQTNRSVSQTVAAGFSVPAQNGMIGVDKTGIHGVDIVDPKFEFTITKVWQGITVGYLKNLRYLVGSVNNGTFLTFSKGELLLLGASGQYKAGSSNNPVGSWSIAYKFGVQYNNKSITVGAAPYPVLTFAKNGWDYVWFSYQEMLDPGGSGLTIPVAVAANVEAVYPYTNFFRLGFTDV